MAKRTINTKIKRFLTDSKIVVTELAKITKDKDVDSDGYGISAHHIYLIQNGNITPNVNTIVMLCKALSKTLNKTVTPNDLIEF